MVSNTQTIRDIALDLVAKGWHVHPLYGKEPLLPGWQNAATNDPDVAARWFAEDRTYWSEKHGQRLAPTRVGIVPGRSGITVIDIDVKDDGPVGKQKNGFDSLIAAGMPTSADVQFPSSSGKGRHMYYRGSVDRDSGPVDGVDLRHKGNIAVVYDLPATADITEALPECFIPAPSGQAALVSGELPVVELTELPGDVAVMYSGLATADDRSGQVYAMMRRLMLVGWEDARIVSFIASTWYAAEKHWSVDNVAAQVATARAAHDGDQQRLQDALLGVADLRQSGSRPSLVLSCAPTDHVRVARQCLAPLDVAYDDQVFYRYDEPSNKWVMMSDSQTLRLAADVMDRYTMAKTVKDDSGADVTVYERVPLNTPNLKHVVSAWKAYAERPPAVQSGKVRFADGVLDTATGSFTGRDKDFSTFALPCGYDPSAAAPEWEKFLDSIGWSEGSDERVLLQMWMGYLLSGETRLHKALTLVGPPRSGKGTILQVINMLTDAVATTPRSLMSRFGLFGLKDAACATIGDMRLNGVRSDSDLIMTLLSLIGGDRMEFEGKNKDVITAQPITRLSIASNEPPAFTDGSGAMLARFVILTTSKSFLGKEDRFLMERLEKEVSGIAAWALRGLELLKANGWKLVEPGSSAAVRDEVQETTHQALRYIRSAVADGRLVVAHEVQARELFNDYVLWCEEKREIAVSETMFGRRMVEVEGVEKLKGRTRSYRIDLWKNAKSNMTVFDE
jgi:putative DNA primase/helicase